MYGLTRHMAKLLSQAGGDAAVAVLSNEDRAFLMDAVQAYMTSNCATVGALAKELGVGRTYVYNLLKGNRIELSRLQQLHRVLGINILEDSQVDAYLRLESAKLSGRALNFQWTSKCFHVRVDKFYLKNFLLPTIESETSFFDNLYMTQETGGKFEVGVFEEETYLLGKISDYARYTLFEMEPESMTEVDSDFYDRDSNMATPSIEIPITTSNGIWLDIEEATQERIYEYYDFNDNSDLFDAHGDKHLDVDFVDGLCKEKGDTLKDGECDAEYERLQNQLEFAVVLRNHKTFNKNLERVIDNINGYNLEISKYCSEKGRSPRRRSYFPLELMELAQNLESGTFQKPIVAATSDASTPLKPEILEALEC